MYPTRQEDSIKNIARSEQSSRTPGGSHQRLKHFQRKDKIVKNFIILNQVVSEKTLMKDVHMCYIGVTEGKFEKGALASFFSFTQYILPT